MQSGHVVANRRESDFCQRFLLANSQQVGSAHFFVSNLWLHGAVAYGYAERSDSQQTRDMTEGLLQALTNPPAKTSLHL